MSTLVDKDTAVGRTSRPTAVRVWDPLVRLFHWSLVAMFAVAWLSGGESETVHTYAGYGVVVLIALRAVWGLVGTRYARFTDFLYRPSTIVGFLKDSIGLSARRYIGHNPAGGIMVVLLLLALGAVATTGIMMTTDAFWGIAWVRHAHSATVDLTILLVALHLVGVALASYEHRENLIKAMITGRKRAAADAE